MKKKKKKQKLKFLPTQVNESERVKRKKAYPPSGQRNIENPGYVYFSLPVAAQLTERGFCKFCEMEFSQA